MAASSAQEEEEEEEERGVPDTYSRASQLSSPAETPRSGRHECLLLSPRTGPGGRGGQKLRRPAAVLHGERIHPGRGTSDRDLR
ncbi:glypican-1-like protein [Lates japonicus]|uniref:Glypican-1-like protein n=1 Tax=Lates japonicus TaxID=270547 RepID=A0AAD3M8T7_LATJO|nr:glypican-1-like protein [Lates japonicus]